MSDGPDNKNLVLGLISTGTHIRAAVHKTLKSLATIARRKFNSYIEEAIDDYLKKIADRIPVIS
ncbi:hypothetical protein [Shinella sp.]|uniref:hypothetical protein n=1 Tax=Shinella sp. TaxID=1870904 RepID=UPI003F722C84